MNLFSIDSLRNKNINWPFSSTVTCSLPCFKKYELYDQAEDISFKFSWFEVKIRSQ